jgi:hypothetical protein
MNPILPQIFQKWSQQIVTYEQKCGSSPNGSTLMMCSNQQLLKHGIFHEVHKNELTVHSNTWWSIPQNMVPDEDYIVSIVS